MGVSKRQRLYTQCESCDHGLIYDPKYGRDPDLAATCKDCNGVGFLPVNDDPENFDDFMTFVLRHEKFTEYLMTNYEELKDWFLEEFNARED